MILNRKSLENVVRLMAGIAVRTSQVPVFTYVKISIEHGSLVNFSALDGEVGASFTMSSIAGAADDSSCVVPAADLLAILRSLPKHQAEVDLTLAAGADQQRCILLEGASLEGGPPDDMPDIQVVEGFGENPGLKLALARVLPAASTDAGRMALNGVHFDMNRGRVVATDGHRLHVSSIPIAPGQATRQANAIVPSKAIALYLASPLAAERFASDPTKGLITFGLEDATGSGVLTARLLDGVFVNYTQVVPSRDRERMPHLLVIDQPDALLDALAGVAPVARKSHSHTVEIDLDTPVRLSAKDVGQKVERAPAGCAYDGRAMFYTINGRYLRDGLVAATDGKKGKKAPRCYVLFQDNVFPLLLVGSSDDFSCVIMPIKGSQIGKFKDQIIEN